MAAVAEEEGVASRQQVRVSFCNQGPASAPLSIGGSKQQQLRKTISSFSLPLVLMLGLKIHTLSAASFFQHEKLIGARGPFNITHVQNRPRKFASLLATETQRKEFLCVSVARGSSKVSAPGRACVGSLCRNQTKLGPIRKHNVDLRTSRPVRLKGQMPAVGRPVRTLVASRVAGHLKGISGADFREIDVIVYRLTGLPVESYPAAVRGPGGGVGIAAFLHYPANVRTVGVRNIDLARSIPARNEGELLP